MQVVPDTEYIAVEVPFRLEDDEVETKGKVLSLLGGQQSVNAGLSEQNSALHLWLYPDDIDERSHITSSKQDKNTMLLVKVRRSKSTGEVLETTPMGKVTTVHSFNDPCDVLFMAPKRSRDEDPLSDVQTSMQHKHKMYSYCNSKISDSLFEKSESESIAYVPPPVFLDAKATKLNKFSNDTNTVDPGNKISIPFRNQSGIGFEFSTENFHISVPGEEPYQVTEENKLIIETMIELFDEQPVWSKSRLKKTVEVKAKVKPSESELITECIGYISYRVKSGAFGSLWLRRGYDPRLDKSSAKYQILSWKPDEETRNKFKNWESGETPARKKGEKFKIAGVRFGALGLDQLFNIRNIAFQQLMKTERFAEPFTHAYGWWEQRTLQLMRGILVKLASSYVDELIRTGDPSKVDLNMTNGDLEPRRCLFDEREDQMGCLTQWRAPAVADMQVQAIDIFGNEEESDDAELGSEEEADYSFL